MKKTIILTMFIVLLLLGFGCSAPVQEGIVQLEDNYSGKKVLYVNSYHKGFAWSDGIEDGIRSVFADKGIDLNVLYMDTKRNGTEEFKQEASLIAKEFIDAWQPDAVIVSDNNAYEFLIGEYYADSDLPVIFCGLNLAGPAAEALYSNTAGMVEVSLVNPLVDHLQKYANGDRVAVIVDDTVSGRNWVASARLHSEAVFSEVYYVSTYSDWKNDFMLAQENNDIIILAGNAGINDWDLEDSKQFVLENTVKPTGAVYDWMGEYTLMTLETVASEQGEFASNAVLEIFDGKSINDIAFEYNKRGELVVNLKIAEALGVTFDLDVLKNVKVYGE